MERNDVISPEQEIKNIAIELRMTMTDEEKRSLLMRYYEANAGRHGLQRRIQTALDELLLRLDNGSLA